MTAYTLEKGEHVIRVTCECCGKPKKRVWGFVSKGKDAHAVYYALLNPSEEQPRVGLTLSIGPWWDGAEPSQRAWVHLQIWSTDDEIQMAIREPQESNFFPWTRGGTPLSRDEALTSELSAEIWAVADFVVGADPALASYLDGQAVDAKGRDEKDAGLPLQRC